MESLEKSFIKFCKKNKYEKNENQIKLIKSLSKFNLSRNKIADFFFSSNRKLGFYLYGDVGVGKTMVLNFFYKSLKIPKQRSHFNEFMVDFHNFRHRFKNKDNSIKKFVRNLKRKCELIYFDEFQITNIVDAMILGKLFEVIFQEKIKVVFTSNIKINELYKDGLQRDQFIPFIKILKKNSIQEELVCNTDYRKSSTNILERFFSLKKEENYFNANRIFHRLTKNKKKIIKRIFIKGRSIKLNNYYNGIAKFDFDELCGQNVGSEDYIKIAEVCNFIFIEKLPTLSEKNLNKKQRFITLIDIFYEKKIPLMITSINDLKAISSSSKLSESFKRTLSRLYELTSSKIKI